MTDKTLPNNTEHPRSAILMIACPDRRGLIAAVTDFIRENRGNIIHLEQYVDNENSHFFMRLEWDLHHFLIPMNQFEKHFQASIAEQFDMRYQLHASDDRPRLAIFVSKYSHCLFDLLSRYQSGEWQIDIPLIISNHPDLEPVAKNLGIDFQFFKVTKENKAEQEKKQLVLLKSHKIDAIVLARYMQILSDDFVRHYPHKIINIHHSFLPAFPGAKPYNAAYERGVKIIGATSSCQPYRYG